MKYTSPHSLPSSDLVAQPEYCTVCYSEATVTSKPPSESENPGTSLLSVCEMSLDSDVRRDD